MVARARRAGSFRRATSRRSAAKASRRPRSAPGPTSSCRSPRGWLVLGAFDAYWRKAPHVKRVVLKVVPDEATRLIALRRGEVDVAYAIRGPLAEDLRRTPG